MNPIITLLIAAIEDIDNDLHYYWEEAWSDNMCENFLIVLN